MADRAAKSGERKSPDQRLQKYQKYVNNKQKQINSPK